MSFTARPELVGTYGMVASTHWLASAAGMRLLEAGGNAFDAAVAAGFVLQVVEPHLNGPGGEVPILYARAGGPVRVIAGQGPMPAAASLAAFADLGLDLIPGTGLLPACVPGAFDAWLRLLAEHGTASLADVLEPAIFYAEHGFPVLARTCAAVETVARLFTAEWPSSAKVWLPGGRPPAPMSRFTLPGVAATYRRILAEAAAAGPDRDTQLEAARRAWSQGFVAQAIADWCATTEAMDTSGRRHRGLLTGDDLARYTAADEEPASVDHGDWRVFKTGPWGQGPVLLQQLRLLEDADLGTLDPTGPDFVHLVVEAAKLAFADREAWYGDPAHTDVPLDDLLSPEYARQRRSLITDIASLSLRPGSPGGRLPRLAPMPSTVDTDAAGPDGLLAAGIGEPTMDSRGRVNGDTCHVSVVDRWGNAVAATPSGGWLQSSPIIDTLGFPLGTRGQMFWLTDGLPNSLTPGKRPRTTLTPSLAQHSDGSRMAFGSPGGDQQDQWSLVFFLRLVHHGGNLQETIEMPMFHSTHMPSSFYPRDSRPGEIHVEGRLPEATRAELTRRGHRVVVTGDWSLGRLSAVRHAPATGLLYGAANPRGMQGYAIGR
jgi:gamma-glutamyltranspeptidase/glutathione hydrolase